MNLEYCIKCARASITKRVAATMNETTLSGGAKENENWHVDIIVDDYTATVAGVGFAVGVVVTLFIVFVYAKVKACRRRRREAASTKGESGEEEEKDDDDSKKKKYGTHWL